MKIFKTISEINWLLLVFSLINIFILIVYLFLIFKLWETFAVPILFGGLIIWSYSSNYIKKFLKKTYERRF